LCIGLAVFGRIDYGKMIQPSSFPVKSLYPQEATWPDIRL
jgi:hypothetical protein